MFSYNENNRSETHLLHFSRSALRVSPRGGGAAAPGKERRHRPATARRAPPEPHPHGRARHGTARLPAACGPADLGAERPNGFAPPRDASLTFLVQFSHFICGPSGAALARPDRRGCGTGAVRAAHRPPRPVPVRPRALCCRSPALLPRPGRAALPPAANAAPGAGWPRRAPHVLRGAPRIRPAAGGHRAPPASRPRLHRGDGRADGAGSRRTGHRTWPQSLAFPPGRGAVSAPRRRQPPARRLPAPPRGGAHCGPEPRHVAAAAAAAARAPAVGRARNGGPRRAPASPRRRAQSALRERGVPGCASASEPRPSVRPSGTGSRSDVAFPQPRLSCSFPLQRWANRSLSEAAASNHTITVMSTNGTAVGKLETLCALRALDVTAQAPSQRSCL